MALQLKSLDTKFSDSPVSADLPTQIHAALVGEPTVTSASAPARQVQPSLSRRAHILIADDEQRIRLALRSCLEAEGYRVQEAADGVEALDCIVRCPPDLMILDLAMPNLDGMRTLSQLQSVHGQLKPKVIVLTAWGSEPAMLKVIGLGADLYLEKPLDPETLRRAVKVVLSQRPEMTEAAEGVPVDWSEPLKDEQEHDLGGTES
jgi:DNA-binding response OmpR family regulator